MKRLFLAAAVLAVAACGGAIDAATHPGQSPTCTVTLSGAVTGTYDCKPASTGWSSSNNTGAFGFNTPSGSAAVVTTGIGWTGEPTTKHYRNTDADAQGGVTVQVGSGAATQVWGACAANGCSGPAGTGAYDLGFSSVTNALSAGSGKAYTTDGTLTATLQPLTGQSGTVTVSVTF